MQAEQIKKLIYYFPWAGPSPAISRKAGLHSITCNTAPSPNILLFLLYSATLYTEHDVTQTGISVWLFKVTCPTSVSSQLLTHLQLLHQHGSTKSRKCLGSFQATQENQKHFYIMNVVFSTNPQHRSILDIVKKSNFTQPKPAQGKKLFHLSMEMVVEKLLLNCSQNLSLKAAFEGIRV